MTKDYEATRTKKPRWLKVLIALIVGLALVIGGYFAWRTFVQSEDDDPQNNAELVETDPEPVIVQDSELQALISNWAEARNVSYAIAIEELDNAVDTNRLRAASYRAGEQMVPASVYKVFVAYAVLHEIEQGVYTLESVLRNDYTIQGCLEEMIVNSENECGRAIGFELGWQEINTFLSTQGFTGTDLYNYEPPSEDPVGDKYTTAADTTKLLKGLYDGSLLNDRHTSLLFDMMERQVWRERIAAGVPEGTRVISKPGWLEGVQTDTAIIYTPVNTYAITILSTENAPHRLSELSTLVYNYFAAGQVQPPPVAP